MCNRKVHVMFIIMILLRATLPTPFCKKRSSHNSAHRFLIAPWDISGNPLSMHCHLHTWRVVCLCSLCNNNIFNPSAARFMINHPPFNYFQTFPKHENQPSPPLQRNGGVSAARAQETSLHTRGLQTTAALFHVNHPGLAFSIFLTSQKPGKTLGKVCPVAWTNTYIGSVFGEFFIS